jgi:O-antigen/teichoic acid export membrane protein
MRFLDLKPVTDFISFFTQGHERSIRAKKNIVSSLVIKGISICISFITLPLCLGYINTSNYGIWLTLSSIVGWFSFFDIGLSQGFRNKFAEAKAKGDDHLAQIYVSTTYAILGIIFLAVWVIFLICNNFVDWAKILKVSESMSSEVSILAIIIFTYFCLSFILGIINTLLLADQHPAKSSLNDLLSQALSLILVLILVKTTEGSIIKLGIALVASPIIVLLCANIFYLRGAYKRYRPVVSKVRFSYARNLFGIGLKFFIIQIASIIQYQTASIIIARNFGTANVTDYNIVYKYFNILFMVFIIFITPFWSASTEAYQKNDIQWIKNGIKRYTQLNILLFIGSLVMLIFSSTFYRLWLGKGTVSIDFVLSFWGFVYFNIMMFGAKYVFFLNGISALRLQFIASIFSPLVYIGIALLLIKHFHVGVQTLFIASVVANFNGFLLAPLQYHMVINKNKTGIWVKN